MVSEGECLFCKIVKGEVPAKKVYEDDVSLAFLDISPRNPGHTLVIPKKHAETILEMSEKESARLFETVRKVGEMAMKGVQAQGLSICQSNGQAAGQAVAHVHFHAIPRFANEPPPGLESILTPKRLDEKSLDKIAEAIKGAPEGGAPAEEPKAEEGKEKGKESSDEELLFDEETFGNEFKL